VMQLLVERVDYDGEKGTLSVTFHPSGIRSLTDLPALAAQSRGKAIA
jgi:hypothetical protein